MDAHAAPLTVATPAMAAGASQFPFQAEVTPALAALLGTPAATEQQTWEDHLCSSRLGVASSLFRALRLKHPPTAKHSLRVALGASALANVMELDEPTRNRIEIAALLHDIGKIGVPDHILNKPSRLDTDEAAVMERHRTYGRQILAASCGDPTILDVVDHVTTWYDGTRPVGNRAQRDAIPLEARIIAILDAFDAMTTDMVYRQALPRERAIAELLGNSPAQFDPALVQIFAETYADNELPFNVEVARRWVDLACEAGDTPWTLESPLVTPNHDTSSIFQQRLLEAMHDGVVFVDFAGRILVWNQGAERLTGLSIESVQHKTWDPRLVDMRDMDGNAIRPRSCPLTQCLRTFSQGMYRLMISSGGQKVAVNVHTLPVRDAFGVCHGATMILHDISPEQSLEQRVQNLHERATTDPLTQVGNRSEFDRRHDETVQNYLATGAPCGLIICDIDRFKTINDRFGHQAGDEALVQFASLIARLCRDEDTVARYGGEEFVVLCPGCTIEAAARKAEQIRRELAQTPQSALDQECMTASFGVTELQAGDSPDTMLRRADRALYQAKEEGRNRVVQIGSGLDKRKPETRSSWFGWSRKSEEPLIHRLLRSNVPLNVVAEKVRGFVSDQNAEIVEARAGGVVLCVDERNLPLQRRQNDRPTSLTIELELMDQESPDGAALSAGTIIDVTIRPRRSRDRRRDCAFQAEQLLHSLKSYLIAEEC